MRLGRVAPLALGLLMLAAAPFATAGDAQGSRAEAFHARKMRMVGKAIGSRLWSLAQDARKDGLNRLATEQAERILRYQPGHAGARAHLGYVQQDDEWVLDATAAAAVSRENTPRKRESLDSFEFRIRRWKERLAEADAFIAEKLVTVGSACGAKGFVDPARDAYLAALRLAPRHEFARMGLEGLGYKPQGLLWLSPQQLSALARAEKGKWIGELSRLEKGLGMNLVKIQTPHFRVEDDEDKDSLPPAVQALERLYAVYLCDVGIDPTKDLFDGKRSEFLVVSSQGPWGRWVDEFSNAAHKDWTKECTNYVNAKNRVSGTKRVATAERVDTRDPLLHNATHILNERLFGGRRFPWLDEGLAYYYTVKVQKTTLTHCVAKSLHPDKYGKAPNEIGGDKDWGVTENWKPFLQQQVQFKNDVPLRTLMGRRLSKLDLPQTVKAWAVVSWLIDRHRKRYVAFLNALRDSEPGLEAQEAALLSVFGKTIEQLDDDWRAFARGGY